MNTRRKPFRKYGRPINPERAIHNRVAHPKRTLGRIAARQAFYRQIVKERAIGVDPIFAHSQSRVTMKDRAEWLKASRAYDEGRHV